MYANFQTCHSSGVTDGGNQGYWWKLLLRWGGGRLGDAQEDGQKGRHLLVLHQLRMLFINIMQRKKQHTERHSRKSKSAALLLEAWLPSVNNGKSQHFTRLKLLNRATHDWYGCSQPWPPTEIPPVSKILEEYPPYPVHHEQGIRALLKRDQRSPRELDQVQSPRGADLATMEVTFMGRKGWGAGGDKLGKRGLKRLEEGRDMNEIWASSQKYKRTGSPTAKGPLRPLRGSLHQGLDQSDHTVHIPSVTQNQYSMWVSNLSLPFRNTIFR